MRTWMMIVGLLGVSGCGYRLNLGDGAADAAVDAPIEAAVPGDSAAAGDDAACVGQPVIASSLPLDIYIMLDQSGSMADTVPGGTKWTAVTGALDTFLQQQLADTSVGIQFFGVAPGGGASCNTAVCTTDADCPGTGCGPCTLDAYYGTSHCAGAATSTDSCDAADYASPAVEIAPLPSNYAAIRTAVAAHRPSTLTPTSAALQGAVNHAKSWGGFHPQHVTIVIFATDGDPTECSPQDIPSIQQIAAAAVAGTPSIRTFVIGVGSSLSNLNGIAAAGGTSAAYMVDTGGNVQQQFLAYLNQIHGTAPSCTYQIPSAWSGGVVDLSMINVRYTPGGGGAPAIIPQVPYCAAARDGWYFDKPASPTRIVLCPATCATVSADAGGAVDLVVGCPVTQGP